MGLLIFLILVPILVFLFLHRKHRVEPHLPPGPKGLPFIGNLLQLDTSNIHCHLWQLSKLYGPLVSLKLGSKQTLVVSSAKMASQVLKTHDLKFCSRPPLTGQHKLSYNGLDLVFAPYNDYWRKMRKICVAHLFNSNRVQTFRPIREDEVSRMIHKVSESASASKPANLTQEMMALTSCAICRVGFGKRFEDGDSESTKFHQLLNETQALFVDFFFSDYFPRFGWMIDRLSGLMSRLEKNFNDFDMFYQGLIDEYLRPDRKLPRHDNILDVLLQIFNDQSSPMQLTFDHIKAILMNVFVAGTDTSAAAVIWAMCFLMKNREAMQRAQEEIRQLVGQKGFVNEDDIQHLHYLKAVVKETMRIQPVAPLLVARETIGDCTLDGYDIPASTLVYVNVWAIGRDPEAWKNPLEFDPGRFLGRSIDMTGQDCALIPFGAGRRVCPGIHIGIATVELSLANLLYKFDWEMPGNMKREEIDTDNLLPGITMHKRDPLWLVPKKYI